MYHSGANTALRGVGKLVPDFLELVDRTSPHKQAFDASIWTTPDDDAEGKEVELHALIGALLKRLSAMRMRAILVVASEAKLLGEQRVIRKRLLAVKARHNSLCSI